MAKKILIQVNLSLANTDTCLKILANTNTYTGLITHADTYTVNFWTIL